MLLKYELNKFSRLANYVFAVFTFSFLFFFSFIEVDITSIENRLLSQDDIIEEINTEFCRNTLLFVPIWFMFCTGGEFDHGIIQKAIASGLDRKKIIAGRIFQFLFIFSFIAFAYIAATIFLSYIYIGNFIDFKSHFYLGLIQVAAVSFGYFTIAYLFIILTRRTKSGILVFFSYTVTEIIISYFLKHYGTFPTNKILPLGLIRGLFYDKDDRFLSFNEVSVMSIGLYIAAMIGIFTLGSFIILKRDLVKL